jgi:hypothetical protein
VSWNLASYLILPPQPRHIGSANIKTISAHRIEGW